ncbi:bifunctional hydroxymethylpyrimidine kinase/phosphomethylpyrimidine kinase [Putridiphycobacter roseus]|uniref:hydroxymethylpyrimidine kinase n=1 Tax=Putridiphycobacter roseus TaxID=2219161 RepID=A0A2W1NHZ3_9FLAO|nr:bifunctional hydroxymethylpyrimidine kinase/phosphomethylpyrimidine kinase [Putridiphycobacter roseus]PZE17546.1 bifunctional hydroxymethylpyrimidine kinase/phosphomethylpyrimidine kinase [Putridiphycobacter roseus]
MENIKKRYNSVLTIAGSDSGGCAGIQADIKSISACGAYAASVITATTAQNTLGVFDIHPIPVPHIEKQLEAVLSDIAFGAIKIGMLHSPAVIKAVALKLKKYPCKNIVIDPVMVATSGDQLITSEAIENLKLFLPEACLITPNIPEAVILLGQPIDKANLEASAIAIGKLYKTSVLLKGGHLNPQLNCITDLLYLIDQDIIIEIKNPWVDTKNTHGTGCTLSSSIAAFLSQGNNLETAVKKGCAYVNQAILQGKNRTLGQGNGPVNHFGL